eukprot:TRINITY_DN2471_c0_g1::TRINITY_DN2471_c0_g1_i2::g.8802::m.8802 TRINITY_DN2471_c0_g1::TRINITY_DN2471_c0_g1_i2::g.8802  ORF type:complete len:599 (-),score=44.81,sp/Q10MX1/P2C32_ORYSJ/34.81/2e-30,PP2C/PF00481.16/3.3e-43,WWE/PF02825.15/0.4,WWE/PF02825.15/9.9,Shisa/PF13908.1/5.8e+03,Shisa/PF13908.1/0.12,Shisa/PF13908.1/7.8e+03,EABR/PF12180.3/0.12,SpoIIE/PF07228.7/0.35,SpoIIE/PF07228.7/1.6e+03,OAD_gamma/PF04277.8/16,OAD_gamma/PF04277.8/1.2e+04,OAD_gamma/PF04277.8/1.1e+02 TRINITY_DN2471_c0_g1_i2:362-20
MESEPEERHSIERFLYIFLFLLIVSIATREIFLSFFQKRNRSKDSNIRGQSRTSTSTGQEYLEGDDAEVFPAISRLETIHASDRFRFHVGWASTIGKRSEMEDRIAVADDFLTYGPNQFCRNHFFGVYDGHGGIQTAQFTSEHLHKFLAESLDKNIIRNEHFSKLLHEIDSEQPTEEKNSKWQEFDEQVKKCIERAYGDMDQALKNEGGDHGSGATVLTCFSLAGRLYISNAGDSHAIVVTKHKADNAEKQCRWEWRQVTADHRACEPGEQKRIRDMGGIVMYGRLQGCLAPSRGFGDFDFQPYFSNLPHVATAVEVGCLPTFVILACDGLWDFVPRRNAVIVALSFLQQEPPDPAGACRELRALALEQGSTDNITIVIIAISCIRQCCRNNTVASPQRPKRSPSRAAAGSKSPKGHHKRRPSGGGASSHDETNAHARSQSHASQDSDPSQDTFSLNSMAAPPFSEHHDNSNMNHTHDLDVTIQRQTVTSSVDIMIASAPSSINFNNLSDNDVLSTVTRRSSAEKGNSSNSINPSAPQSLPFSNPASPTSAMSLKAHSTLIIDSTIARPKSTESDHHA